MLRLKLKAKKKNWNCCLNFQSNIVLINASCLTLTVTGVVFPEPKKNKCLLSNWKFENKAMVWEASKQKTTDEGNTMGISSVNLCISTFV